MTPTQPTRLSVVKPEPETRAQAAFRLQRESEAEAAEAVRETLAKIEAAQDACADLVILQMLPPGIREEGRRLAEHLVSSANTIASIQGRVG